MFIIKLSEFLSIIDSNFDHKVESGSQSKKISKGDKLKTYLGAFISLINEDENILYNIKDDYALKIFNGREQLPKKYATFIKSNIDPISFENFCEDLSADAKDGIILQFAEFHELVSFDNFEQDITSILDNILYYIINVKPSRSIRDSVFISDNKIKIGGKTINLPPELIPTTDILDHEIIYVDALFRVYSQAEKLEIKNLDDLKNLDPKYEKHFKMQRLHYFSAESVLRQIRDIFVDGESEFNNVKSETLSGISPVLLKPHKNALSRVDETMTHVVRITYGKSFLARPDVGYIGNAEKQGIVHLLVNDGDIIWVVDYDENI